MLHACHAGKFELGRRTEHDVQPLEVAALGVPDGNPCIERLIQRGSGVYRTEFERCCKPGSEHQQARDGDGQPMHGAHPSGRHPLIRARSARPVATAPVLPAG